MDSLNFCDPKSQMLQLKANDDDRVLYIPYACVRGMAVAQVTPSVAQVVELDISFAAVWTLLRVCSRGVFVEVPTLSWPRKAELIDTVETLGIQPKDYEGFEALSDAIFVGGDAFPWEAWKNVADRHRLDMYTPADATKLIRCYLQEARREIPLVKAKEAARRLSLERLRLIMTQPEAPAPLRRELAVSAGSGENSNHE